MNILIIGDSWGNGAYDLDKFIDPCHPGLEYYLNQNHTVTNLSVRGGSMGVGIILARRFIEQHGKPDVLIWWQCAFMREVRDYFNGLWERKPKQDSLNELDLNWDSNCIEEVTLPLYTRLCTDVASLGVPVIAVGGNASLHPHVSECFTNTGCSASELVIKDFVDSFFSDRIDLEMFSKTYLKKSKLDKRPKYDFIDQQMVLFNRKWDTWNNSKWICMQHGTTALHLAVYEQVKDLL